MRSSDLVLLKDLKEYWVLSVRIDKLSVKENWIILLIEFDKSSEDFGGVLIMEPQREAEFLNLLG